MLVNQQFLQLHAAVQAHRANALEQQQKERAGGAMSEQPVAPLEILAGAGVLKVDKEDSVSDTDNVVATTETTDATDLSRAVTQPRMITDEKSSSTRKAANGTNSKSNGGTSTENTISRIRVKDKEKHKQSENKRRMRIRDNFNKLRVVSDCSKTDQRTILQCAIKMITYQKGRITELEREIDQKRKVIASLNDRLSPDGGSKTSVSAEEKSVELEPALSLVSIDNPIFCNIATAFISLDGRFQAASNVFCELLGYEGRSLSSLTIFNLFAADDLLTMFTKIKQLLSGEMTHWEMDQRCLVNGGSTVNVHITMTIVKEDYPLYYVMFLIPKRPERASWSNSWYEGSL